MPKLVKIEPVADGCRIGVLEGKNGKPDRWYVYMYFEGQNAKYESLKLEYLEGNAKNLQEAVNRALSKWRPLKDKHERGLPAFASYTLKGLRYSFFKDAEERVKENEELLAKGLTPVHIVKGGRGYWSRDSFNKALSLDKNLAAFFETFRVDDITKVKPYELNGFLDWSYRVYPTWAPSTRNKHLTLIRQMWRYAIAKGWIHDAVPVLDRARADIPNRRRMQMTTEDFILLRDKSLQKIVNGDEKNQWFDLNFQFHHFIMIMSWCGIRVPSGKTEHTCPKWSDYIVDIDPDTGEERRYLFRPKEKTAKPYFANIHPESWQNWDALKAFHINRGTYDDNGFIFVHTHDQAKGEGRGAFSKGDRITNWNGQWRQLCKSCGWDFENKPASQRYSLYSLRGFYISNTVNNNLEVPIEVIARSVGTSPSQIEETYLKQDRGAVFDRVITRKEESLAEARKYAAALAKTYY